MCRAYAAWHTSGLRPGRWAPRVASEMEGTGKFALSDGECAERHVKFVGDLLGAHRSPGPGQSADASQGDDGARCPRLGPAVSNDAESGGVGQHLPGGLRVGPPEAAPAPGGGEAGGMLANRLLVSPKPGLPAHRLEYRPEGHDGSAHGLSAAGFPALSVGMFDVTPVICAYLGRWESAMGSVCCGGGGEATEPVSGH